MSTKSREDPLPKSPMAWSPDGRSIIYSVADRKTGRDLWLLSIAGDRKAVPLLNSPFNEAHPQISPDGKWIAYVSDRSGWNEIYVKSFPAGDSTWPVSVGGGVWPRWRRDGKEIFYLNPPRLMAVGATATGSTFESGVPHELFDSGVTLPPHVTTLNLYAVSPDGQRFLFPIPAPNNTGGIASSSITVVLNWPAALKK